MAITTAHRGRSRIQLEATSVIGTDWRGKEEALIDALTEWSPSGGTAPTQTGFLKGTLTVPVGTGDILLAHVTDPLQAFGDATWPRGFTASGSKLKELWIEVATTSAGSLQVARAAANGLPIFLAASDGLVTLPPGGLFHWRHPTGVTVTSGSTDALTLVATVGTVTATLFARFGD